MLDAKAISHAKSGFWLRVRIGVGAREKIECVSVFAQRQEQSAVLRILFEYFESQNVGVKRFGALKIANGEQNMADALKFNHLSLWLS